jgi:hypothetical protein
VPPVLLVTVNHAVEVDAQLLVGDDLVQAGRIRAPSRRWGTNPSSPTAAANLRTWSSSTVNDRG